MLLGSSMGLQLLIRKIIRNIFFLLSFVFFNYSYIT
ncbi:hypothetical protein ZOSMA_10G01580 [Zostera marina]|uniref:Uncharacterized protein n=1 Tax=Zostera marina TaxID=29655 RepID=A0A0K9Q3M3_ZOSMR|nr:hypothetical protein ZOSMA_10G01580 [Zostera marina]